MYNEKQIRQLLTRFMEGHTTVEEEQEIARWFAARREVAPDLEDYRQMLAQGGLSVADGCRCLTKELDMIAC